MFQKLFSKKSPGTKKERRYIWRPAIEMRGGWMLSTLLPFTHS